LLRLVTTAYGDLPRHRLTKAAATIDLRLVRSADDPIAKWALPPQPRTLSGGGLFCCAMDSGNFATLSVPAKTGLIAISPRLMEFPYHARYELLEFSVFTLASRVLSLVPLHAACVSHRQFGLLLMGDSGAGKSTLTVQCLLHGLDFVSEDSAFVHPANGLVTGIANYVHVRPDTLRFLPPGLAAIWRRNSQTIRRRSGIEKLEANMRQLPYRLAPSACRSRAVVLLTTRPAGKGSLLRPVPTAKALARLQSLQPYAAAQPSWPRFLKQAAKLPYWELRRGSHPGEAAVALKALLRP
jgi:hypothetical protein